MGVTDACGVHSFDPKTMSCMVCHWLYHGDGMWSPPTVTGAKARLFINGIEVKQFESISYTEPPDVL